MGSSFSTVVVVFFFYCSGDHRDLHVRTHSFPTRRSSDLTRRGLAAAGRADEPERLALDDVEADPGDGLDRGAPSDGELHVELIDAQQGVGSEVGGAGAGHQALRPGAVSVVLVWVARPRSSASSTAAESPVRAAIAAGADRESTRLNSR